MATTSSYGRAIFITPMPVVLGDGLSWPDAEGWVIIGCIACLNGTLGHFLMNWSHEHIPIVGASLLTLGIVSVLGARRRPDAMEDELEVVAST